jgi:ubiquitin-activating enzyme E1
MKQENDEIDESLYSRQLYVMGHEAQRKMATSSVLIVGLNGLGVEVAKNVILAGVKSVTLYDTKAVSFEDLSAQFYLTEAEIGQNRAVVSAPKLAELNPHVKVSVLSEFELTSLPEAFKVVVLVDVPLARRTEIADFCHAHGVYVVACDAMGVFGRVFCDFGPSFVVNDVDGEAAFTSMIAGITCDEKALVSVLEETRHNLSTGDIVTLADVQGLSDVNDMQFCVEVKDPFSFTIEVDTSVANPYQRGGYVTQVKQPSTVAFQPYSQALNTPGEFCVDFAKMHRVGQLHMAFRALDQYQEKEGALPEAGCAPQADALYALTLALNDAQPEGAFKVSRADLEAEEQLVRRLSLCCRGVISPVAALLGGIVGQEVLKACSGKFMPIRQFFYFDAVEALTDTPLAAEEVAPMGCRYDGQIMVFGRDMQRRLGGLNMFLVGAGAIGCEMVKNWAMMGVSCSDGGPTVSGVSGVTYVTDMDHIEKSNLSRQFLFRNSDINCPKSSTAVRAVKVMNASLSATAYESKVANETEALFNDDFFEGLDMVCTALDNVEARLYMDQKCLFYQKPMLESGTLGAKGHTQIVVPFKTENYGATRDPPEKSIPVCTLKHFPNQIEHTLQWARDWFEEAFSIAAQETVQYLTQPDFASTSSLGRCPN